MMKNILTILATVLLTVSAFAQAPEKMSYQAVIRDVGDMLITDTTLGMQISILEGSPSGTAVYVETQMPATNANGLASLEIGAGTVVSGDFSMIDWGSGEYYIKTETDPSGGSSYSIEGTSQLLSVPYALYAKNGAGLGNTLDQSYDQEMTTDPSTRIINADDGAIEIIATDNIALKITADPTSTGLFVFAESNNAALYVEQADEGDAVHVDTNGDGVGIDVNNAGTNTGVDIDNSNAANAEEALRVANNGTGDAVLINNVDSGGGDALNIANDGGGDAITIDNDGAGEGIFLDNTDSVGGIGFSLNNDGGGAGIDILNDGGGRALDITNDGGGNGIALFHEGAANAVNIGNAGTGIGLNIVNGAPVSNAENGAGAAAEAVKINHTGAAKAVLIENEGTSNAVHIINGNPANDDPAVRIEQGGAGTTLMVENGGPGKAAHFTNAVPLNSKEVVLATSAGVGIVGHFVSDGNNANFASTLVANHMGAGSAGEFHIMDEATGKVNDKPIIVGLSNGMGPGLFIDLGNAATGGDMNSEPAIFATHKGFGHGAFLETFNMANDKSTLEIKNNGTGHGAHIDSYDNPGNTKASLYVEQGNSSTDATLGRTAIFDLHPTGTSADAAVLIRSGATSLAHSTLRVIRADPTKLAATFEGDVEVATDLAVGGSQTVGGDLTVGGTFAAAAKAFKIDHPLDPENKFLVHNSIESNERVNMYSGNITTNNEGYATVQLADYMSALNRDFKYQLTIVDKSFAQAIIWEPMNTESNSFIIKTNNSNVQVSWLVTGVRQDTWAKENPMQVEVEKKSRL